MTRTTCSRRSLARLRNIKIILPIDAIVKIIAKLFRCESLYIILFHCTIQRIISILVTILVTSKFPRARSVDSWLLPLRRRHASSERRRVLNSTRANNEDLIARERQTAIGRRGGERERETERKRDNSTAIERETRRSGAQFWTLRKLFFFQNHRSPVDPLPRFVNSLGGPCSRHR